MKKNFLFKCVSVFVGINLLLQTFYPTVAMALTGGPSQPEMQGFEPIGTSNMVDLSSGSFTYNIPLMDVEGYPINLSYHSGVTMDQEASWAGLGWNVNVGEINRQMRGLPDDFKGDQVTQEYNMKNNITIGFNASVGLKLFGLPLDIGGLNLSGGIFYNNYKGPGMEYGIAPSINSGSSNKGVLTGSLGLNFNSQSGFDISPSIGFSHEATAGVKNSNDPGITVGTSYNSRSGIKGITMSKDLGVMSTSSSISFSAPTYVPTITMPLVNNAITLEATIGASVVGGHPNMTFSGYYNEQALATKSMSLPSFGYMYADQAFDNPYALHDFNREKDIPFQQHIANLPITNFTYDLFSINGQGVSGEFRPFRGDVGVLYDHENTNQSQSSTLGVELGVGDLIHNGIQLNFNSSNTTTDKWIGDNDFASTVDFMALQPGNINYEPFYIKSIGEKTINDIDYYNTIANESPMYVHLDQFGSTVKARNLYNYSSSILGVFSNLHKTQREKRNQSTSILNVAEASGFGLDKSINSYPYNKSVYGSCTAADSVLQLPRCQWPIHHISEITVTNPDGKRYVYGIPAYNIIQKEATFAVNGTSIVDPTTSNYYLKDSTNLIGYSTGDNSTGNSEGLDNYFNEQTIPQYSHSFLLTGVLSPDYVDLTGDGITDDDLGEAVKINYTQVYSQANPFKWRTPFEYKDANYQVGLMSLSNDDKANYLYGTKEVWYVHSVESKTMVAQFVLQDRYDAFGVAGEDGGIDSSKHLKCIKAINLYSKADLIKNGAKATPIKTVHFVYDYELCQNVPNASNPSKGKLTLKEVYFTYGNNTEGSLNSYQFTYSSFNPPYDHNRYDRWGYYKYNGAGMPPNEDFPYTLQDSTRTGLFSTAWNLTGIDLPSGGHITVKYEPNDYAYVQNQRANQMFLVRGIGSSFSAADSSGNQLYSQSGPNFNNWVFVDLPEAISSDQDFYNKYLAGLDGTGDNKLYFRFLVNCGSVSTPAYEYVPGYADISPYASGTSGTGYRMVTPHMGAIELSEVPSGNDIVGSANPIAIASWQFVRLNLPNIAYPGSKVTGSVLSIIEGLLGIIPTIVQMVTGFDEYAVLNNFGNYIVPNFSYLRLDNPNYKKLGGGTRVKEIDISDNWSSMVSGQSSFQYGQTYSYTKTMPSGQVISSGVATYEPISGGDENPLRQPLPYDEKYLLAPNNAFYTETPLGESLYPSPGVVYSSVTVTNLKYPGVTRTATGYTVNEFYTAYDFPVMNNYTDMIVNRVKPSILLGLFGIGIQDYTTATQGFNVEVNDMAGKEKSQEVYDEHGSLISSVNYDYLVDNPSSPSLHLSNNVEVVNQDGSISPASIGKDIDLVEDMREQDSQTQGMGTDINLDTFIVPFFGLTIPSPFPDYSSEHTRFRSAVTTKYIHRTGLIDKITKTQNGSTVITRNLLYDGETGEVLLTQTNNEFDAPVYSYTYPAHDAYDGMAGAYKNIGAVMSNVTTHADGTFASPSNAIASAFFAPGDEVEFSTSSGLLSPIKMWVTQPNDSLVLMDAYGGHNTAAISNVTLKIIRSGRRNMASIPIGSVTSLKSPIINDSIKVSQGINILQASGTLFNDVWKIPYNAVQKPICDAYTLTADTCLAQFLDSVIIHHKLFAKPGDSLKFGKYVTNMSCSSKFNELFYALVDSTGLDEMSSYQAQLGNCVLNISGIQYVRPNYVPYNGYAFLDGLRPYPTSGTGISITSSGCLNLFTPCPICGIIPPPTAIACLDCRSCHDSCVNLAVDSIVNPYAQGILGSWRPERNYVYYDSRSPSQTASTSDIWKNGVFNHFNQIWDKPKHDSSIWRLDTADKNWTWTSRITMYDQKGNEVEDVDALGRYSSALYGYVKSLPVAVASNARNQEIAFDGFEDYGFNNTCSSVCDNSHFSFISYISDTTSTEAHTGKYSLKLNAGSSVSVSRNINYFGTKVDSTNEFYYYLLNGGNSPLFAPDSGSYLLSAWVKENVGCGSTGYAKDSIIISYGGSSAKYNLHTSGPLLEGWQRFEGRFKVPKTASSITVDLVAGSNTAYYDDIRIEPFAAEMKTYVYDPFSLRLMATLDENNYATFYEYNDEGILMRVKKETEKGIMTIKESRSSYKRQ